MLFLLSPAKSLDFDSPVPAAVLKKATDPLYAERAAELIGVLRRKTPEQLGELMSISPTLAKLNAGRYRAWKAEPDGVESRPAVLAFDGDVYGGLDARTLKDADLTWAQQHLVILSGLYGVLRPLDRLQPYRLEMGTGLATKAGRDLYAWWGDALADHLNERQADERSPVIVNLASVEYARAVLRPALKARVVDCVFEEVRAGGPKIVSFYAKRARGLMARHAVKERARSLKALCSFDAEGYAWDAVASSPDRLVFRREAPSGA